MHINPPCNQTSRCLWWLGLISNNRKNMFTEPPLEVGKSRLISVSGQTASFFPTLLFDLWENTLQNWSTCSLCSAGLGQWGTPEGKQEREDKWGLGICLSLWGGLLIAVSFQGNSSNLGSPLHRAPTFQVLVTPSCSALQAKLCHSSAPRTGYCPTCMLPVYQGSRSRILHKTYSVW